mgnify:CR=1 FL=1
MSRASVGDKKTTYVNITKRFVKSLGFGITTGSSVAGWGLSKARWVEVLVKAIGWKGFVASGVMVGAAATCAHYYLDGYNGVRLKITWTYMYGDSSMSYFWGITGINPRRY